jgi:hypothetical protein
MTKAGLVDDSVFDLVGAEKKINYQTSHVEDRMLSVLYNTTALIFFNEFCLREYSIENVLFWVESEIFKTITDVGDRYKMAKRIIFTYIKPNSPLCLNIEDELRASVGQVSAEEVPISLFDELQGFIQKLLKLHAYPRYELSDLFEKFIKLKDNGI